MEVISKANLDTLIGMGFEVTYQAEDYIKLFCGKYNLGIDLFCSDPKDDYTGVYMHLTDVYGVVLKEGKARNVISNVKRYIERVILQ